MKHLKLWLLSLALLLILGQSRAAASFCSTCAYIAGGDTISAWDDVANTTTPVVSMPGGGIDSLVFDKKGNIIFDGGNNQIFIYNIASGTTTLLTTLGDVSNDLAMEPSGGSILIASKGNNNGAVPTIYRLDLSNPQAPSVLRAGDIPDGIIYDDKGNLFACLNGTDVVQLSTSTGAIMKRLPGLVQTDGLTFNSTTGMLYVGYGCSNGFGTPGCQASGGFYTIPTDLSTFTVTNLGYPIDGLGTAGNFLYLINRGSGGVKYDLINSTITQVSPSITDSDDIAPLSGLGSPNPPPPSSLTIQFSAPSYTAHEGDGFILITVTRSGTGVTSQADFYTRLGSAIPNKDYVPVSGTLTFDVSDTTQTFEVPILNGNDSGGSLELALTNPRTVTGSLSTGLGPPNTATLTILGQNPPPKPPPAPFISQLVPYTAPVNFSGTFGMHVLGSGFDTANAQVIWNGSTNLQVTSRTAAEIDVISMDSSLWGGPNGTTGPYPVIVRNTLPVPADSNPAQFTVRAPGTGNAPPWVDTVTAQSPVYTQTGNVSARGNTLSCDINGVCGEALLTYEWFSNPLGVTFANNKTHAGRTSVATFPSAGTYSLFVRVTDISTNFAVDSVAVNVIVIRNATKIDVEPKPTSPIGINVPLNFTATIKDQWGVAMNLTPKWSNTAGSLSLVAGGASFTASDASIGFADITASVTNALNVPLSDTAHVTIVIGGAGSGDISNAKAYPVPWKSNGGDPYIHFTGLAAGTKIRLFTITGRIVKTLDSPNGGEALWDITNADFNRVSSGVYMYIIEGAGQKKEGKVVVIQ